MRNSSAIARVPLRLPPAIAIAILAPAMTGTGLNVLSFLFLGFFLGMRHATDAM